VLGLGFGETATAATVHLSRSAGPPTTRLTVSGGGFGTSETITLSFDSTPVGRTAADASGAFPATAIRVPRHALPGQHRVVATGATSRLTADASFLVRTNWAQFHFDSSRRGFNRFENILSRRNAGNLVADWGQPSSGNSSPVVARGLVFVGSESDLSLHAYNARTGAPAWSRPVGYLIGSPTVAAGVVYANVQDASTGESGIVAFKAKSGALVWKKPISDALSFSSPAVANGTVYVGTAVNTFEGIVYALDASSGATLWTAKTAGQIASAPAVASQGVYVTALDKLYVFDAATGALRWARPAGSFSSSPAVAAGRVFVGSDKTIHAYDATTGVARWSATTGGTITASPAVANGILYVAWSSFRGIERVVAREARSGHFLWRRDVGENCCVSGPWTSSPAIANGVLYIGSTDGELHVLDAKTGAPFALKPIAADPFLTSPAVADGRVYLMSYDNPYVRTESRLYAFALP
jgi:outer membrane protein assembly factor BamB